MPSYAILGATGNVGQALHRILLQSPDNTINAYCRSKQKLFTISSQIAEHAQVTVYEGAITDVDLLANCIRNTKAVFLTIAVYDNEPNCTVAQDASRATLAAFEKLQSETPGRALPKLIILSSAKIDKHLSRNMPAPVLAIINRATSNQANDLIAAESLLREHEDWIEMIFVKPGGLCRDTQKGHKLSLETEQTPLSYLDLAAGMIEVADSEDGEYRGKNVSVIPTGENLPIPWESGLEVVKGLLAHYMPWTYPYTAPFRL